MLIRLGTKKQELNVMCCSQEDHSIAKSNYCVKFKLRKTVMSTSKQLFWLYCDTYCGVGLFFGFSKEFHSRTTYMPAFRWLNYNTGFVFSKY